MAWQAERTSTNQKVQVGAESTSALGTPVAATKLLECFSWNFGVNADVKMYRPTGHKYDSTQEENIEWSEGSLDGTLDFNGIIYPLASVMGSVAPVAHGVSSTAKDWIFTPPITGSVVPQTYTLQQGDSVRAHQIAYGLFTSWGYKVTRKDVSTSGKWIGQLLSDGATLTSNPTAVAIAPVVGKHWNVYLDPTSGALGTTQLTRVLSFEYSFDNVYAPFYALNRSTPSYTAHVDMPPKATAKLLVEADAAGMALLGYLQSGTTYYLRMDAQGNTIDVANSVKNKLTHDMAVKVSKPNPFKDDQGIFAIEWELTVVEDPSWSTGQAQTITVTNLITAL